MTAVKMSSIVVVAVSTLLTGCVMSSSRGPEPSKSSSRAPVTTAAHATPAPAPAAAPALSTQQVIAIPVAMPATNHVAIPLGPPPDEPISPQFARPAAATAAHLQQIEPAILELAKKAESGDRAYFIPKMGQPGEHMVESMMEKVKACDLPKTYRAHLIGDRLNYHDTMHVQIELAEKNGKWDVSRLWFCR